MKSLIKSHFRNFLDMNLVWLSLEQCTFTISFSMEKKGVLKTVKAGKDKKTTIF